jgi:hypothetical protein
MGALAIRRYGEPVTADFIANSLPERNPDLGSIRREFYRLYRIGVLHWLVETPNSH